jgi:hypothetical protein
MGTGSQERGTVGKISDKQTATLTDNRQILEDITRRQSLRVACIVFN